MKTYLVTGGCGFIGSNLVKKLIEGSKVIVVDNLSTGVRENLPKSNRIDFMPGNSGDYITEGLSGIFHLGMPSSTELYREDPRLMAEVVDDGVNLCKLAVQNKCKLVFASTSSIYNGNKLPYREDMEVKVKDFYTEARYYLERSVSLYNALYGLDYAGVRFFSVYGGKNELSKGKFANLVTQFLIEMSQGKSPVIYGDGEQTRDFVYVDDIVDFLINRMNSKEKGIFNAGVGVGHSLNDVVSEINDLLGIKIKPIYKPTPLVNYVQDTLADKKTLKIKPKVGFSEGIYKTYQNLKSYIYEKGMCEVQKIGRDEKKRQLVRKM